MGATGGKRVARLATVRTQASVGAAAALVHGKGTPETPGTIHVHGLGATGRDLVARRWAREG